MISDYKEKVKKLLALAESSNEFEAKAALLKARQLMAEHKIRESELEDVSKQEVKTVITDIVYTTWKNPWIANLTEIIGENYCCKNCCSRNARKKTRYAGFIGFESDIEICVSVFKYAVDCIMSQIKALQRENRECSSLYKKEICDNYGYGFVEGLREAFRQQQKENEAEWGLVLVIPKEVEESHAKLQKKVFKVKKLEDTGNLYGKGYNDGKAFDPTRRVAAR